MRYTRRKFVASTGLAAIGAGGGLVVVGRGAAQPTHATGEHDAQSVPMGAMGPAVVLPGSSTSFVPMRTADLPTAVAARLTSPLGFAPGPMEFLSRFDYGTVSRLADGRTLREYTLVARDVSIEVAPGIMFPAWTYNGSVPGPTLRGTEGDRMRVTLANGSDHPHTIHFHGIHAGNMDGVFEQVSPGESFTYEFEAEPFGMHHYHCHTMPLAKHIAKGLYGAFIVDPKQGRPAVDREMVMVLGGFDVDFDEQNEFYMVNGPAFFYQNNPIQLRVGEKVRIYLSNMLEFDPINSFHLHANFFDYYPTGTRLEPTSYTDTIALVQGERGILEFSYKFPGRYLFHAHKSEFAELGWTGVFGVEA